MLLYDPQRLSLIFLKQCMWPLEKGFDLNGQLYTEAMKLLLPIVDADANYPLLNNLAYGSETHRDISNQTLRVKTVGLEDIIDASGFLTKTWRV